MRAVDGLAILLQPCSQSLQAAHLDGRDGAIRFRPYVKQKIAVLADDIDQQIDEFIGSDSFGFTFRPVVAKRSTEAAAFFPFGRD